MIGDHQRESHSASRSGHARTRRRSGRVRLVPVRALPAGGLVEDGAELALALVEGRQPDVAVRRPLLGRVDDPVGLVEPLRGARPHVRDALLVLVEAGDVRRLEVDLGLAVDHPLGQRAADAGPLLDPHRGGRPQPLRPRASRRGSAGRPGVSESRPLIAYLMPTDSSPTISGISSSACSICWTKSSSVNGSSVGESADSSIEGISSGSCRIGRWAYEPTSSPLPSWRSYMFVSMSRTIGYSIALLAPAKRGTGPMSIIWCTAGVSGIDAPAMRASRGLQTPQAITTTSVSTSPRVVRTRRHAAVLDVDAEHLGVGRHRQRARLAAPPRASACPRAASRPR